MTPWELYECFECPSFRLRVQDVKWHDLAEPEASAPPPPPPRGGGEGAGAGAAAPSGTLDSIEADLAALTSSVMDAIDEAGKADVGRKNLS